MTITDTGQYWQHFMTGLQGNISFLLVARVAHLTNHDHGFQIVNNKSYY